MKRKIIIHRHLFKNAGTTFDWSLKRNFEEGFIDHREDNDMIEKGQMYLSDFIRQNPGIKALSSHHICFQFAKEEDIEYIPVSFLRHPIERIRSVYNFERQQISSSIGAKTAKKKTFKEYVSWRMREDVPFTIRDFQTRYFCGYKKLSSLNEQNYHDALEEILKYPLVGIVDKYDESMRFFEKEFQKKGIKIDLHYEIQNALQETLNVDVEERAKKVLEELGDLANEVLENNQYDLKLYYKIKNAFYD